MPDTPDLSRFTYELASEIVDAHDEHADSAIGGCWAGAGLQAADLVRGPTLAAIYEAGRADARAEGVREGAARVAAAVEAAIDGWETVLADRVRAALAESTDPEETR